MASNCKIKLVETKLILKTRTCIGLLLSQLSLLMVFKTPRIVRLYPDFYPTSPSGIAELSIVFQKMRLSFPSKL